MVSVCFAVITLISFVYAVCAGNTGVLTGAILDGAGAGVRLSLELCGMSCLWSGILQVFADSGVLDRVCRILSPVLGRLFPEAWRTGVGKREITAAVSANLLGIGNAATPYALSAMRELDRANPEPSVTSAEMGTFAVLGSVPPNLFPSSLIALRQAAGSLRPAGIVVPVWIGSAAASAFGMLLCRLCAKASSADRRAHPVKLRSGRPVAADLTAVPPESGSGSAAGSSVGAKSGSAAEAKSGSAAGTRSRRRKK